MNRRLGGLALGTLSALYIISCTPKNDNGTKNGTDSQGQTLEVITTVAAEDNSSEGGNEEVNNSDAKEIIFNDETLTVLQPYIAERYEKGNTGQEELCKEAIEKLKEYENKKEVVNYEDMINYFYNEADTKLLWTSEVGKEVPTLWINEQSYPYSYGHLASFAEQPSITLKDINGDGTLDVLSYFSAYRTELRQDVYLSQSDGTYLELGDITWNQYDKKVPFEFSVEYKDEYMVQIQASSCDLDVTELLGDELSKLFTQMGVYDEDKKLAENGQNIDSKDLQRTSIYYAQDSKGNTYIVYETRISVGYSDYALPYGFQFIYSIHDTGYELEEVNFVKD